MTTLLTDGSAPLAATNDNGEVVRRADYEPFGRVQPITRVSP